MTAQTLTSRTGWQIEVADLDDLFHALHSAPKDSEGEDGIDWASLPVFGGAEPADTSGVWAWDEDRLLIGDCLRDLEIVTRAEWESR